MWYDITTLHYFYIGDKPTLQQLQLLRGHDGRTVKVINEVSPRWEELAITLQFSSSVISYIKTDYPHSGTSACCCIFTTWLDEEQDHLPEPVTWATLIQCLTDADFSALAQDIEEIISHGDHNVVVRYFINFSDVCDCKY